MIISNDYKMILHYMIIYVKIFLLFMLGI